MKCKCGNNIEIRMGARVDAKGCKILTAMTTIVTAECTNCGERFQVPISSSQYVMKEK